MADQQVLEPIEETVVQPSAKSEREHRHLERLRDLEIEVAEAEAEWMSLKASASTAKKQWEAAVSKLRAAIRKGPDAQLTLPLSTGDGEAPVSAAWRDVPIGDVLHPTENKADMLADNDIKTLGDFEDYRGGVHCLHRGKRLTDLPGVGEALAQKWEDAVLDWLSANRDNPESEFYVDPDPADEDDEDEDDDEPTPDDAAEELDE